MAEYVWTRDDADNKPGVIEQHRTRAAEDSAYRESHLTPPGLKRGPANTETEAEAKVLALAPSDRPGNSGDDIDDLTGDDLENAVRDADIAGRSSMTADEKRAALRAAA